MLRRTSRVTALAAITTSFAALVHHLGRPARFHHMLRVAKPSSPMSVGTCILTLYGALAALPELRQVLPRRAREATDSAFCPASRGEPACRSCSWAARPQRPEVRRCPSPC